MTVTGVAILDDYQDAARHSAAWDELGDDVSLDFVTEHLAGDALLQRLSGVQVVVAMRERTPFPAEVLAACPDLRLLITTGMGNAAIDIRAAERLGITVCGTGSLASPTAELTWALLLALARGVIDQDAAMRRGGWEVAIGTALGGKTFGVIGLGRLGRRVARIAQAFDMPVLAWSQNLDPAAAREVGVEPVTKAELLGRSEVVSVHTRLSDRTRGLIGPAEFALMRPSAYLINTSRGPIVDTPALIAALENSVIAGAGIDVYDQEPLPPEHPLRSAPNTVLTPHIGYVTHEVYRINYSDAVENIASWLAGTAQRVISSA